MNYCQYKTRLTKREPGVGDSTRFMSLFPHLSLLLIRRRNRRARREIVQGAAGQAGNDVRVADGEGEAGLMSLRGGRSPTKQSPNSRRLLRAKDHRPRNDMPVTNERVV